MSVLVDRDTRVVVQGLGRDIRAIRPAYGASRDEKTLEFPPIREWSEHLTIEPAREIDNLFSAVRKTEPQSITANVFSCRDANH